MDIKIQFIRSCVIHELNNDDLAYITKWAFKDESDEEYFQKVLDNCNSEFFEQPNKIKRLVEGYYMKIS